MPVPSVDHAVINVLYDMDAAADVFRALGFHLTPRGFHSLGSINHLMMFGQDYLELVGLPTGTDKIRREVADSPRGLNGLVFLTEDADAEYTRLLAAGVPTELPLAFGRPVDLDGTTQEAKFRTVRLKPGFVQGGRVYFCEQRTRHLVWRPEWQSHANGAVAIAGFTVVVPDPAAEARRYATVLGQTAAVRSADTAALRLGDFALEMMTSDAYLDRYGDQAFRPEGREAYMGAVTLRTTSLADVDACFAAARDHGIACRRDGARATVSASSAFDSVIAFIE
ncbi:VOC family protein [Pigmentiphaga litoralis]|uniref:VOC domain-containing protein n=1 Tax=Pigmentiphaga litoralis TaxID=516702 RepID=A0A7Y9ISM0_9BURK|nr:VOC family protein [Pigmentiphaga litoralis]NYE24508.1 hypothetical protein [Pigmentiphaga litoralis]NYE81878.1 hypothetical protein [Pigmentiphaga litoralis]